MEIPSYISQELILQSTGPSPSPSLPAIIASRLQFAMDILQAAPRMMVTQTQTPWCHSQLYRNGMPRVMQDAFAACSLYMTKNTINAPVILSIFDSRVNDLISLPTPSSPLDLLARTHALILYQIMRLFDGDIRSRTAVESLFPTLEYLACTLMEHIYLPDPTTDTLLPSAIESVMTFWDDWIFQESARRTVLLTFYFMQIYKTLQGKMPLYCDGRLGLVHAWYSSAHLWDARDAFDFAVAWTDKPHLVVQNGDFSGLLEVAKGEDVDLFGKMLLVTVLGVEKVKAWFYERGSDLISIPAVTPPDALFEI
ncbi:hypothetical protein AWENTII_004420 [Aspergillus wentii]